MALELKDIKPVVSCGVQYKESPIFFDMRAHLKDFLKDRLNFLQTKKKEKYEINVEIDKEGDVVAYLRREKDKKSFGIGIDMDSINATEKEVTSFDFFEEDVPSLFDSLLDYIKRKNVFRLGIMFKARLILKEDIDAVSVLKNKLCIFKEEDLSILKIKGADINRIGIELKFKDGLYLHDFTMSIEKNNLVNEALITVDTRLDKTLIEKEIEIKDSATISDLFKKVALPYFLDSIVNGIAKEIFNLRKEEKE